MAKVHVKTGDTVMIISGKDRGHSGKVLQVSPAEGKVIVEGQNMVTKHVKPRRQGEQGGIVKAEGAMYASKVMPVCPKCGKAVRVGHTKRMAKSSRLQKMRRRVLRKGVEKNGKITGNLCQGNCSCLMKKVQLQERYANPQAGQSRDQRRLRRSPRQRERSWTQL